MVGVITTNNFRSTTHLGKGLVRKSMPLKRRREGPVVGQHVRLRFAPQLPKPHLAGSWHTHSTPATVTWTASSLTSHAALVPGVRPLITRHSSLNTHAGFRPARDHLGTRLLSSHSPFDLGSCVLCPQSRLTIPLELHEALEPQQAADSCNSNG